MKKGFTLIELLIVVIIVGILASLGMAGYTKTKEVALGKEAKSNLKLIFAVEKVNKLENGAYVTCVNTSACNTNLKLNLVGTNWNYAVASTDTSSRFTATATRSSTACSAYCSCVYSLDQSTTGDPSGTSCP